MMAFVAANPKLKWYAQDRTLSTYFRNMLAEMLL